MNNSEYFDPPSYYLALLKQYLGIKINNKSDDDEEESKIKIVELELNNYYNQMIIHHGEDKVVNGEKMNNKANDMTVYFVRSVNNGKNTFKLIKNMKDNDTQ